MRIAWTRRATLDLYQVREFLRGVNPAAAERVGERLQSSVAGLARFPESGRAGKVSGARELVMPSLPYLIIYRVRGDRVQILRILHSKQKWPQPT
jgi:toxin ParE1/3/4